MCAAYRMTNPRGRRGFVLSSALDHRGEATPRREHLRSRRGGRLIGITKDRHTRRTLCSLLLRRRCLLLLPSDWSGTGERSEHAASVLIDCVSYRRVDGISKR